MTNDAKMKRTHTCGQLRSADMGKRIVLTGWVNTRRDHGGLIFVDMRDRYGLTQVVFNPEENSEAHSVAESLRSEYVIAVSGTVSPRPEGTINEDLPTGEIEVVVESVEVLNEAKTPPFEVADDTEVSPELRLKYRYIDLRREPMQKGIMFRHKLFHLMRNYLDAQGFVDIETPMLTKSTPEGARDFLVPSRVNPGHFYALPQSPQLFKQVLMVSGYDRYYQVVRCFRDEDLRADRQPEFTQLDIEMSFVDEGDIIDLIEGVFKEVFEKLMGQQIDTPFLQLSYEEAMLRFGTDKPDLRYEMEIVDITDLAKQTDFKVFKSVAESGGCVRGITAKGGATKYSRREIDELVPFAQQFGAKGLAWIRVDESGFTSPIAKFFSDDQLKELGERMDAEAGDLMLFIADKPAIAANTLGPLRESAARKLDIIPKGQFKFCWVVDFPMFERNEEENRWEALHHPFTSPKPGHEDMLESDPEKVSARAYDIVLNGTEIGGGSIRIHREDVQERVFRALGIDEATARQKFGFLLDALQYGAPPHGGIALGLDRVVTLLLGLDTIRDVIAFPKTQRAFCLMTDAPGEVDARQLKELGLKI